MGEPPQGTADVPGGGRHIVLVGLPGAGKTTVGRLLAARLGLPFIDFDEEIVRREGRPIAAIFAAEGEAYFRRLEAALTAEMLLAPPSVIAPGGGWIAVPGLPDVIRQKALLVHLRATPRTALSRMGAAIGERPLIASGDAWGRIQELWVARRSHYATADLELDTEMLEAEEVARAVAALIDRSAISVRPSGVNPG